MDMRTCAWVHKHIIDRIEGELTEKDIGIFNAHLKKCPGCSREYEAVHNLYKIMQRDEVPLPDDSFWDTARQRIREQYLSLPARRAWIKKLLPITAVASVVCIALVLFVHRPHQSIEMVIPVVEFLEDEDIAALILPAIVHDDVFDDFMIIEESLPFDIDETVKGMTSEEQELFIKLLIKDNGIGI